MRRTFTRGVKKFLFSFLVSFGTFYNDAYFLAALLIPCTQLN